MDIIAATATAYQGLKAGTEILSAFIQGKVDAESQAKITDALSKLGDAQSTLFELQGALFQLQADNDRLRRQLDDREAWNSRLAQYELTKTAGGAVVYGFKGEPTHYVCPSCVNKPELHILQDNRTMSGKFRCTGCEAEYPIEPREDPQAWAQAPEPYND
jgi:hypothetical protein